MFRVDAPVAQTHPVDLERFDFFEFQVVRDAKRYPVCVDLLAVDGDSAVATRNPRAGPDYVLPLLFSSGMKPPFNFIRDHIVSHPLVSFSSRHVALQERPGS